jgi:hypothetical protein
MEVSLETVAGQIIPEDTFVSIRIGEVNKQTRFAASRTHRFPESCVRESFARIEVFKRIGSAMVDFDSPAGDYLCEGAPVDVACDYPGLSKISWQVTAKKQGASKQEPKQPLQRMNSAQQYLKENNLEVELANVVQELLKTRPKDAYGFVSSRMQTLRDRPSTTPSGRRPQVLPPLSRKEVAPIPELQSTGPLKSLPPIDRGGLSPAGLRSVKSTPALLAAGQTKEAAVQQVGLRTNGDNSIGQVSKDLYALFPESERPKLAESAPAPATRPGSAPDQQTSTLRSRGRSSLREAVKDGSLLLGQQSMHALRCRARRALSEGSDAVASRAALVTSSCSSPMVQSDLERQLCDQQTSTLQSKARGSLKKAMKDGSLLLGNQSMHALRCRARRALSEGADAVASRAALVFSPVVQSDLERQLCDQQTSTLQSQGRRSLREAMKDGSLLGTTVHACFTLQIEKSPRRRF